MKVTVAANAVPLAQSPAVTKSKLADGVGEMKLDGVRADASPARDLSIAHPVPHGFHDTPFAGRQDVRMRWSANTTLAAHWEAVAHRASIFPPLPALASPLVFAQGPLQISEDPHARTRP